MLALRLLLTDAPGLKRAAKSRSREQPYSLSGT